MSIILLDIDGVVCDFKGAVRRLVDEVSDEPFDDEVWDFTAKLSPLAKQHYKTRSAAADFCRGLRAYDGAVRFIERLQDLGEVVAVTSPLLHCPTWEFERRLWLPEELGFRGDVISTGRKDLVHGDVLIEDSVDNLTKWSARWRRSGVLVTREYNAAHVSDDYVRAASYDEVIAAVRQLL